MKSVRKMILVPIEEWEKETLQQETRLSRDHILKTMAKHIKHKAEAVLDHIDHHSDKINWSKTGELVLHGQKVPSSHIVDVLKGLLYNYKSFDPVGKEDFRTILLETNIPRSLINQQKGEGEQSRPPPGIPPKTNSKRDLTDRWKWISM